jgi:hypothetical protein
MERSRLVLDECLLLRAGELAFQFGRYDMYAVLLERLLSRDALGALNPLKRTLTNRGVSILHLLSARNVPALLQARFLAIETELQIVLERCEVSASNAAHTETRAVEGAQARGKADWYDGTNESNEEISNFIEEKERDILEVISLYIRVANLSQEIRLELPRLH